MGSENQPLNTTTNQQQELPPTMRQDLEKERQTSARLLNDLATALYKSASHVTGRAASAARRTGHAAQYVQEHYVRDVATGLGRFIRRHPTPSLIAAVLTGYAVGRALRRR